ncbi:hypothetical protein F8M41_016718 [Gigaspora margarita]|uniref:Uncharacterized protein n=1 Tax=Gigaspora margarita TaxID=4874 RepID=A0A8H4AP65_GIGMA|nr:hypothetical protein F8M41_016718 [Gigaspora margarita]
MALVLIAATNARRKNKLKKLKLINPGGPNKPVKQINPGGPIKPVAPINPGGPNKPATLLNQGGPNKPIPTTTPPAKIAGETPTTITPTTTKSCRISCPACATAKPIHCEIACSQVCD